MTGCTAQLQQARELLSRGCALVEDPRLDDLLRQLDEPLYVVLLGEFNTGKSALLNALLGARVAEEGVIPTTDRITLVSHDPAGGGQEIVRGRDVVELFHPSSFLQGLRLVDTPGTNSILERHRHMTEDFLHRAELVLFVLSAGRSFSESEKEFLRFLRGRWDRKLVCVINKVDHLEERGRAVVEGFVREACRTHLDVVPPIFQTSARQALEALAAGDEETWERSGVAALQRRVRELGGGETRELLKLGSTTAAFLGIMRERSEGLRDRKLGAEGELAELQGGLEQAMGRLHREIAGLVHSWHSSVDLALVQELEARVRPLGLRGPPPLDGQSGGEQALSQAATHLQEEMSRLCRETAAALAGPRAAGSATGPTATPPAPDLRLLPDDLVQAARARLRRWYVGGAVVVVACLVALPFLPHPWLAALAGAAVILALWHGHQERCRLAARVHRAGAQAREHVERLLGAAAESLTGTLLHLDPHLAHRRGEQAELGDELRLLDDLVRECWELRQQLGVSTP